MRHLWPLLHGQISKHHQVPEISGNLGRKITNGENLLEPAAHRFEHEASSLDEAQAVSTS